MHGGGGGLVAIGEERAWGPRRAQTESLPAAAALALPPPPPRTATDMLSQILYASLSNIERRVAASPQMEGAALPRILGLLRRTEFKRRQLPFAFKVSPKAFGAGRRIPLTAL